MITTSVNTTGFADLDAKLRDLQNTVIADEYLRDAMLEAVEPVADRAKAIAKRDSGDIANSIRVGDPRNARDFSAKKFRQIRASNTLAVVGCASRDAHMLEFGTYKDQAQPFMRPALEVERENVTKRFAAALRRRLGL